LSKLSQAGWRGLALISGALLLLLAGYAATAATLRSAPLARAAKAHKTLAPKPLPLPSFGATLDGADPAPGYQEALWSGTTHSTATVVSARVSEVSVPLSYGVHTVFDPSLALGHNVVAASGTPGVAMETVRRIYQGAKVVSVAIVGERVVRAAKPEIVHIGAKLPEVSRGQLLGRVTATLNMVATAYWADPSWSNGRTATGVPARYGVAAVDPTVIPLGTRLYIPGYGYAVAADTGGAIVGDRIDLCFDTGQQALDYGRQSVTIYVLTSN
jgi:3D (Asp-Asp-Asp) domain-containing protein